MCFRAICYWRDLIALAGVYTFSFLAVMGLFGIGNLLLKFKRKNYQDQRKQEELQWLQRLY
jgi:hypothetical protein